MSCPSPYKISVKSAFYELSPGRTCSDYNNDCANCSSCWQQNVTSVFSGFNGQTSASLRKVYETMGVDSCNGRQKYTYLTYQCIIAL